MVNQKLPKSEFTKVFIFGQKHRRLGVRPIHHFFIRDARGQFGYSDHFVPCFPQTKNYAEINIFIRQQLHAACPETGYITSALNTFAANSTAASTAS